MNRTPMATVFRVTVTAALLVTLSGCGLFKGDSRGATKLQVSKNCSVDLVQLGRMVGSDKELVTETVTVSPDCTTEINFKESLENSSETPE